MHFSRKEAQTDKGEVSNLFFRPWSNDDVSFTVEPPAQRKVHESKSCVDNGYRLCGRAVAIAPLPLNYQMQIKLECRNADTKTRRTLQNGSFFLITHESLHQWSQCELGCSLCMQWKVWSLVKHHVGLDKIRVFFFWVAVSLRAVYINNLWAFAPASLH